MFEIVLFMESFLGRLVNVNWINRYESDRNLVSTSIAERLSYHDEGMVPTLDSRHVWISEANEPAPDG